MKTRILAYLCCVPTAQKGLRNRRKKFIFIKYLLCACSTPHPDQHHLAIRWSRNASPCFQDEVAEAHECAQVTDVPRVSQMLKGRAGLQVKVQLVLHRDDFMLDLLTVWFSCAKNTLGSRMISRDPFSG